MAASPPLSRIQLSEEQSGEAPSSAFTPVGHYPLSQQHLPERGSVNSPLAAITQPHCLPDPVQMPILVWSLGHLSVPGGKAGT